ncbi:uncharacterized protein BO88DRAFT_409388, partial [Aspergillus vadensis CBS 113365]
MSQHHENIFDKMFHHHKHQDTQHTSASQGENDSGNYPSQQQSNLHETEEESQPSHHGEEEGVVNRFENYIKEDEELEREGQTYGGL